jgi:hypothetical protein
VRELEDGLAGRIEAVLLRDEGVELGPRTRRDGVDGSGLTVDFTYDEAGHALEVTTTPDVGTPTAVAAAKLADRLSEVASGWIIVVSDKATMRDLDAELLGLIATGVGIRPGEYGSADIVVLGRRAWSTVMTIAAVSFLGVAFYRPLEFQQGLERVSTIVQREFADVVDPALERLTTTTTSQSPPASVAPANP